MAMVKMTVTMSESKMPSGEYDMVMKSCPVLFVDIAIQW
jgi:hypothetical protein